MAIYLRQRQPFCVVEGIRSSRGVIEHLKELRTPKKGLNRPELEPKINQRKKNSEKKIKKSIEKIKEKRRRKNHKLKGTGWNLGRETETD